MKLTHCLLTLLLPAAALAAEPRETVAQAAAKLAEAPSYSWTTTTDAGAESRFRPGPVEGSVKEDWLVVKSQFGDNTLHAVKKGEAYAIKTDDGWKSGEELRRSADEGDERRGRRGRFAGRMIENFKAPATQARDLAAQATDLKEEDGAYAGTLSAEAVQDLLTFGRRREGADRPAPTDAAGSVRFWIKDDVLSKYEVKVSGTMRFGENEFKVNRTTTTEISNLGGEVEIPAEAKEKLGGASN